MTTGGEVHEVAPPSTRTVDPAELSDQDAPAFVMSAEGQALRAKLDATAPKATADRGKPFPPRTPVPPSEPPAEKLATPEDRTTPGEDTPIIPELALLPGDVHAEAAQLALDTEAIAVAHGIPVDKAQNIYDALADLWASNDQELNVQTAEQCVNVLQTRYGLEASKALMDDAAIQARSYGPDFIKYLDGGAGNAPSVVLLLALMKRGETRYTPSEAAAKLKALRATGDFSKLNIDQSRVLARLAQPKKERSAEGYAPRDPGTPTSTVSPMIPAGSLRERLNQINADPRLMSADGTVRKKLVEERARIMAALSGRK